MTFDYKIIPVRDKTINSSYEIDGFPERRKTVTRRFRRDRRRKKTDRRSSIREGVIVTLSFENNRRKGTDRRSHHISR